MPRIALVLPLLLVLLLTGCRHDEGGGEAETPATPVETGAPETAEQPGATEDEEAVEEDEAPGAVLGRFVDAARDDDTETMWALLSPRSQERLGPTIVRFEEGVGRQLRRELARFARDRSAVFLDEAITATFAVAGYGGRLRGQGRPYGAYAAALRRQPDGWRLELGGPITLTPVAPDPASTVERRVRIAAEVRSEERAAEAGIWLDGRAVPGRIALTGAASASMFTEDAPPLPAGPHAAVAFAATRGEASATAWVFARRGGGG